MIECHSIVKMNVETLWVRYSWFSSDTLVSEKASIRYAMFRE